MSWISGWPRAEATGLVPAGPTAWILGESEDITDTGFCGVGWGMMGLEEWGMVANIMTSTIGGRHYGANGGAYLYYKIIIET